MAEITQLQKNEYFENGESVFIQYSDNIDYNDVLHKHNFIELSYVVSGTAMHKIDGKSYRVKKGNVIMVDYNVAHAFSFDEKEGGFYTYDLLFTPDFFNVSGLENNEFYSLASSYLFSSIFADLSLPDSFINLIKTNSKEFYGLFKKIYEEFSSKEKCYQSIIRAYLIELIIKIFREIEKEHPAFTQSHRELVEKAINYMKENYKSHISLDDIVSGMFLSKNYFRQIFKKTTGISISSYIQELRISEACRLLEATDFTSAKIAEKSGFNDMKFFYSTFKKATGMTPSDYRRKKQHTSHQ